MRPTRLLAGLLIFAAAAFDLAVASRWRTAPETALMLLCGAGCGQLALLSVWLVWGASAWLVRLTAVLAAAGLLSLPLAATTGGRWSQWFVVLCLFAGLVGAPLATARWAGLAVDTWGVEPDAQRRRLRHRQYSLAALMSLMTTAALVCGLARHVVFPWPQAAALASYGACLTCVAVASLWAMLSRWLISARITVLTLLCLVAGGLMYRTELTHDLWFFTMVTLLEALVICAGFNVWLTGGLQMDWLREQT
jgi:hypothetical protein